MALKFLNKKGWHTGSLRNIENVWKAEQKHDAEQKKLEELRKQIQEERERSEFRLLQEQAGLVPRQERLEFLYDSGLAVGKGSSSSTGVAFKALEEALPGNKPTEASSSAKQASAPGALFEEKPHSANDTWRKLHSDPLLLIRQREQEALARVKNNPVQMAQIRKSVEVNNKKDKARDKKKHSHRNAKHHKHSSSRNESDTESSDDEIERKRKSNDHKSSRYDKHSYKEPVDSADESSQRKKNSSRSSKYGEQSPSGLSRETRRERKDRTDCDANGTERGTRREREGRMDPDANRTEREARREREGKKDPDANRTERETRREREGRTDHDANRTERETRKEREGWTDHDANRTERETRKEREGRTDHDANRYERETRRGREREGWTDHDANRNERERRRQREGQTDQDAQKNEREARSYDASVDAGRHKGRNVAPKLSEEERAAKLREMQMDAELHEDQRWKRLKKAADDDAREAAHVNMNVGKNFLDAAHKSVYGAEKGGSSTIEESVRRRTHYLQGRSEVEGNAFRR